MTDVYTRVGRKRAVLPSPLIFRRPPLLSESKPSGTAPSPSVGPGAAIARNAFHLVIGQILTTAMSIVLSGLLGRRLGTADFGVFFMVGSLIGFAYVIVEWGQSAYVVRTVAREPERGGEVLASALLLRIAAALLLILPSLGVAWALRYAPRIRLYCALMMITYLPLVLSQGYGLVFRARERMDLDAVVTIVAKALTLGFTAAAFWWGGGLPSVYIAQGLAGLGACAVAALLLRKLRLPAMRLTRHAINDVLRGGTAVLAMNLSIAVHAYLDTIVFSKLAPPDAIGWYGAARILMNGLMMPAPIIASAAFPRLSRSSHDPALFRAEARAALRPLLLVGALAAVGTWLFADVAVGLVYGTSRFGPTVTILKVFAPGMLFFFVSAVLASMVVATGRSRGLAVAKLAGVVIGVGLDFVFIAWTQERWGNGGIGVVLAFAASELLVLLASVVILPDGTLGRELLADLGRAVGASAGTLLLFGFMPAFRPVLAIPACIAVFLLFSLAFGLVTREDAAAARDLLRRRLGLERA